MASTRKKTTKNGEVYYEIRCRVSRERPELTMRWYIPHGWSQRAIDRELVKTAADFEARCKAGEILSREERQARETEQERQAAAIMTVEQYGKRVFMPAKNVTCSENTRNNFEIQLRNHIYPMIGEMKMPDVTSAILSALLLEAQSSGLAHASCVKVYCILKLIFKMAFLTDLIDRNPMDKVERPKPRKNEMKQTEVECYTVEELQRIIACLKDEPLKWQAYIRLMIDTGMRRGECCGLQWKDVDFTHNKVTISCNLCYTAQAGVYLDTPKNGKSRTIGVDLDVMELIKRLRIRQANDGAISSFVFTQEGSTEPMCPQTPTRYMQKFAKRYGIERMHPHKLRHSQASIAIINGADIASVSEKLGHADKSTTLRLYTHANEASIDRASNIFRDALSVK